MAYLFCLKVHFISVVFQILIRQDAWILVDSPQAIVGFLDQIVTLGVIRRNLQVGLVLKPGIEP